MKEAVLVLLAVLGCSLADGRLLAKCELRDQLMKAISDLTEKGKQRGLAGESLVAKIVCFVEHASGFNTSAVNQLFPGMETLPSRRKREASYGGLFSLAEEDDLVTTVGPHNRGRRQAQEPPSNTPPPRDEEVWTLYGLFQLSNHLVCSDGQGPSPNVCGTSCSSFNDDDIRDDIRCVLKLLTTLIDNGFSLPHLEPFRKMIRLIFHEECRNIEASEYFNQCSQPEFIQ